MKDIKTIADLVPDAQNARSHNPRNVGLIVDSLHEIGAARSIVIDEDGVILAGNATIEAAAEAGIEKLKVVDIDGETILAARRIGLTPEQKRLLGLYDNRTAELAGWNAEQIVFQRDEGLDLSGLWGEQELSDLLGDLMPEQEEAPEPQMDKGQVLAQEYGTAVGQLWELGGHRLMIGDCTAKAIVDQLMAGEKAGVVVTDPPYGIDLDTKMSARPGHKGDWVYKPKHYEKVIGDNVAYDPASIFAFWGYCAEIFLWGADYYAERIPARNAGSWLVWDKREGIEDIEFSLSSFELCWSKARHARSIIRKRWMGLMGTESQDICACLHPTQKPIEVIEWILSRYSGDIVVDPFLGSGTTMVAAHRLGLRCFGCELDPAYAAVSIKRWEDLTGDRAVLLTDQDDQGIYQEST